MKVHSMKGPNIVDAVVVGGGFGGCYMLHLLRREGLTVKLIDAQDDFGGVWRANWYPGARVDCEMPYYLLSAPELMAEWIWTERFPSADELRAYFKHVDRVWKLSKDSTFNTRVVESRFSEEENLWYVRTDKEDLYSCKWFLPCTGSSNKQNWPEFNGKGDFKGQIYHPAGWPRDQHDLLKNKRVAVIGAGSSAIQIVQEAAKTASQLTQFIKTPNTAIALQQRQVTREEVEEVRPRVQQMMAFARTTQQGLPYPDATARTTDLTSEECERIWEANWKEGGFKFSVSFIDATLDEVAGQKAYDFWLRKVRPRIKDPLKREILAPSNAPYLFFTKRFSLEDDYYEMCSKDNVDVTDSPVASFDSTGIRTEDGKHREFDIIVCCTGYDAVVGSLKDINIIGRQSRSITEHWSEGILTYLGLTSHGFPNMFFVYGPQAPTSFTAGPPFIEQQVEWVVDVISKARKHNWQTVEATANAEKQWRDLTLQIANQTLLVKTDSWYMGSNVPGKRREMMLFLGGMKAYFAESKRVLDGMAGFDCSAPAESTKSSERAGLGHVAQSATSSHLHVSPATGTVIGRV